MKKENFEVIENLKENLNTEAEVTKESYYEAEAQLVNLFGTYIMNANITCKTLGNGKVTAYSGDTLETMIIDITFAELTKRFSMSHILNSGKAFVEFTNEEIANLWQLAWSAHSELTVAYKEYEAIARQLQIEAEKKAAEAKKNAEKYERLKTKAIKDFSALQNRAKEEYTLDTDFYFALGWLTKHAGPVTASLPDFLDDAFKKYFGEDTPHTVIDSKRLTSGGFSMKWNFSFKASLRKAENIPAALHRYMSTAGNHLASTSFIWDLVEDFGFKFGKKQSVESIKSHVPTQYISTFEAGLAA